MGAADAIIERLNRLSSQMDELQEATAYHAGQMYVWRQSVSEELGRTVLLMDGIFTRGDELMADIETVLAKVEEVKGMGNSLIGFTKGLRDELAAARAEIAAGGDSTKLDAVIAGLNDHEAVLSAIMANPASPETPVVEAPAPEVVADPSTVAPPVEATPPEAPVTE